MIGKLLMVLEGVAVWLSRIGYCRGFGIQSPADYWLVRYVINEHWPYYQYETIGRNDDWLTRKLGRLCFRMANWRQPSVIESSLFRSYLQAGCHRATFGSSTEMVVLSLRTSSCMGQSTRTHETQVLSLVVTMEVIIRFVMYSLM